MRQVGQVGPEPAADVKAENVYFVHLGQEFRFSFRNSFRILINVIDALHFIYLGNLWQQQRDGWTRCLSFPH